MKLSSMNAILQKWTGKNDLSKIETSTLEAIVKDNAFSPSLQFLLTKKYELEQSGKFSTQLLKATSYFPTSLHLHQLLVFEEADTIAAPMQAKLSSLISEQLAQFNYAVDSDKLEFEKETPQIIKDYFGAQGIEIDLSKIPQDKFTQQLRSFTAWLKVLKQSDENGQNLTEIGEEQEKVISILAEKANNMTEVITEAMAEIWLNQGNIRKAIDIYSKLSFIFPEKSVYFASRIEQLKNNNK
jgi:hypothetical protein